MPNSNQLDDNNLKIDSIPQKKNKYLKIDHEGLDRMSHAKILDKIFKTDINSLARCMSERCGCLKKSFTSSDQFYVLENVSFGTFQYLDTI